MAKIATSAPAGSRSAAAGYTLLELLVVLLIVGLMAGLAMPAFSRLAPGLRLHAAAQEVAAALKAGRREAMQQNREVAASFDLDARSLQVGSAAPVRLDGWFGMSLLTAVAELDGAGVGAIRFFPDGTSTGGRVRLITADRRSDVVVGWLTGLVSLED